ncbi:hypothetical protein CASFOL_003281 [Castilleja foliolosa]|uniref:Uncharacterized protein n=1 Tax=Castilleja foliolosa TaxID=1961234 RepID=A0ABD3EH24_9LAMI
MSAIYDNWERLVAAVLKKEQLRQLCHAESIATTTSVASSLAYTSSFSPSVQNAVVSDVTSHHQIPAVKRCRRHRPVAPDHQDSYFSYQDEMLVIYEQHQSLRIDQLDWESCLRIAIDVAKAIANHHKMKPLHMDDDIIIISDKKRANIVNCDSNGRICCSRRSIKGI